MTLFGPHHPHPPPPPPTTHHPLCHGSIHSYFNHGLWLKDLKHAGSSSLNDALEFHSLSFFSWKDLFALTEVAVWSLCGKPWMMACTSHVKSGNHVNFFLIAGHFHSDERRGLCEACDCHPVGAVGQVCAADTGQCACANASLAGRRCDQCQDLHFGFDPIMGRLVGHSLTTPTTRCKKYGHTCAKGIGS